MIIVWQWLADPPRPSDLSTNPDIKGVLRTSRYKPDIDDIAMELGNELLRNPCSTHKGTTGHGKFDCDTNMCRLGVRSSRKVDRKFRLCNRHYRLSLHRQ